MVFSITENLQLSYESLTKHPLTSIFFYIYEAELLIYILSFSVEKAAKVFSLKLDSGHKLLCPWIDNICDETLAQFPPLTASLLVDSYKERCSALLQLLALPIISFSAIDYMKSPQLDKFLSQSSMPESGNGSDSLYYQVSHII